MNPADKPPAPTFVLLAKPRVTPIPGRLRWQVTVTHAEGLHIEAWRTHEAALNCARAIVLLNECRPVNPQAAVMAW